MTRDWTRVVRAGAMALVAACGSDGPSGPSIGPPASVSVSTAPSTTGTVGGGAGVFAVRVVDAAGQGVAGAVVTFAALPATAATFSPASVVSDAAGGAQTTVTLGIVPGTGTVTASVSGVPASASASIAAIAGAPSRLVNSLETARLFAVGDTVRIGAALQDQFANPISGVVLYTWSDSTLITVDGGGLVRALRVGGVARVVASSSGQSDTTEVIVRAAGASECSGMAQPTLLAVGATATLSGADICLPGGPRGAEFAVVAYNTSLSASEWLTTTATVRGLGTPTLAPMRDPSPSSATRQPVELPGESAPSRDVRFHHRILASARDLRGLVAPARAARAARLRASQRQASSGALVPSVARASIPSSLAVGEILVLNTNARSACGAATKTPFRVAAVGTRSVVLADTLNPANGFTDLDYRRFAARFDTLVYPLDVEAFGAPSDMDGNGKVAILFTKAVNELTERNAGSYVGGFFHPRDLFPRVNADGSSSCQSSNEGEMFYMLVPDPTGVVNGNRRSVGFVDSLTVSVIAHEFQHLINAGRRLYVNTAAEALEDSWLNEGLSHIAEELLYYRESGKQPRQHLGDAQIRVNSGGTYGLWKSDAAANFRRFIEYLENPDESSPLSDDDELSTRGASWAFLRYAVDRSFSTDAGVWQRFGNSVQTGMATLQTALQTDPRPLLADFAVTNYVADLGINAEARYVHRSWNFRDIYTTTFGGSYPLRVGGLAEGVAAPRMVRGSSAAYMRFAVSAGSEALLGFTYGDAAARSAFKFTVIRTK